jgi:DNA-binding NtrC family response regulator
MPSSALRQIRRDWFLHEHGAVIVQPSPRVEAGDVDAVLAVAAQHAIGCRVVHLSGGDVVLLDRAADALRKLGFVIVRGGDVDACRAAWRGRHVALLAASAAERFAAVAWVRALSRESPRGHVVVTTDEPGTAAGEFCARERAPALPLAIGEPGRGSAHVPDARISRARRFSRSGRVASASRWTDAAIAAARRRGDESSMVAAATRMIDLLVDRGELPQAIRTARRLLAGVTGFGATAEAVALLVRPLLLSLELDAAEALVAGARVEAVLRDLPAPDRVIHGAALVCFWRGRFEEAVALARIPASGTAADLGAAALAAWGAGDRDLLWTCRARMAAGASRAESTTAFWSAVVDALFAAMAEPGRAPAAVEALVTSAPPWLAAFAHAVAIEAGLRGHGALRFDSRPAQPAAGRERPAPLFRLLLDWQQARARGDAAAAAQAAARARHAGLDGLARWGRKDACMQLLHDWSTLLRIVHEAEDELSALTSGCAWVRRQGHAVAVAVADADGTSWLAFDGCARHDLAHPDVQRALSAAAGTVTAAGAHVYATAPVRYAGRVIGRVIAKGNPASRMTLEQAVQALAAIAGPAARGRLDTLAIARAAHVLVPEIIGRSPAVEAMRDAIARAAGTAFPVLIEGESGTGKELVARALHKLSPRRDRRFCAVNCAAFTDELFEAELFGYARGAFTGAVGARAGLIEDAHDGTLFLDEVGDLSARAQAKLLRTLQEREVRRLGENAARRVDVRVVAATNVALDDAVGQGRFREDLLFRLAVIRIRVPPLRDRAEDIALIASAFWRRLAAEAGRAVRLGPDVMAALGRHRWPGNIRELQNVLAALLVLSPARGRVTERHLSQVLRIGAAPDPGALRSLDESRRSFERQMIAAALARHGGRQARAAHELGLTRQGLAKAMRRLDLDPGGDAAGVA